MKKRLERHRSRSRSPEVSSKNSRPPSIIIFLINLKERKLAEISQANSIKC